MLGFIALMALVDAFAGLQGLRKRTPAQALRAAPASMFNAATAGALAVVIGLGPRAWVLFAVAGALVLYDRLAYGQTRHRPGARPEAVTARLFR